MKKRLRNILIRISFGIASVVGLTTLSSYTPEEGMFPLNYLNITQLKNAGLKLDAKDIFNPGEVSLTDALVKVGGCTGSFISDNGLIITNHHCVYGNVARLSTPEQNYLENGFVARTKKDELPVSMPCKITQSYEDVSDRVLKGTSEANTPAERMNIIAGNIKGIVAEEKLKHPDLDIQVSEMFVGKSYTLFRYIYLKDVRLVMAPPLTVGQFGGDTDNWEWPRHNGDFSLVRAYVGPDGKPAPYSENNIPYTPKNKLKVNPAGTQDGDFVFIMGYPGRTFRHESGAFLDFQKKVQLPTIQSFFKQYIDWMKQLSANDEGKRLSFARNIQWMENVEKNYRGKMQGLRRTRIVQDRIDQDMALKMEYKKGTAEGKHAKEVVERIHEIWADRLNYGPLYFYSGTFTNQSAYFKLFDLINRVNLQIEEHPEQKDSFMITFQNRAKKIFKPIDIELEKKTYKALINGIRKFSSSANGPLTEKEISKISHSKLWDADKLNVWIEKNPKKLLKSKDILISLHKDLLVIRTMAIQKWSAAELELKSLMPQYINFREEYLKSQFIPDANSTLRLTYGYIRGYSPNDGENHYPYTSLDGVFEKANTLPDYRLPKPVQDKLRQTNVPGIFKDPKTGKIVVGILYNMDTTGGNSGSPVLNDKGELIGINFDRSFTATINDYAWNEKYSRSIGVDIRYALYVLKYISEADDIIAEMGVNL